MGISTDMLEAVFGMFTQVNGPRDSASGGLGIGLTLVRSMVELHGGSVTAESNGPGERQHVPRASAARATHNRRTEGTASTPAEAMVIKRVLIADDNVDAAESLQLWLEMAGHEVHTALTGPAALKAAETVHPQVALLDVGMPGMSGLEVAAKIREAPWGREMVLIALTGWGQDEDRRRSQEAGFDHHLTKPVVAGCDRGADSPMVNAAHSCRSATSGSTDAARRAGTALARSPATVSTASAAIIVLTSLGSVWKRKVRTTALAYQAITPPSARPTAIMTPALRSTIVTT